MENFILGLECCKPFWSNGDVSQQSIFSFSFVFSATWTFLRCSFGCAFRLVCPSLNSHGFLGVWARLRRWTRSPGKKIWCCKHHHVGCHGPSRKWFGGSLGGFIRWQLGRNGRNMGWLAMWYAGAVFGARTNPCSHLFIEIHGKYIRKWGAEETGCLKIHERRYLIWPLGGSQFSMGMLVATVKAIEFCVILIYGSHGTTTRPLIVQNMQHTFA